MYVCIYQRQFVQFQSQRERRATMSKTKNPPKAATLTEALRWHLRHADEAPVDIAKAIGVNSSSLYRFLSRQRGLSDRTTDRLARYLRLRLVREPARLK